MLVAHICGNLTVEWCDRAIAQDTTNIRIVVDMISQPKMIGTDHSDTTAHRLYPTITLEMWCVGIIHLESFPSVSIRSDDASLAGNEVDRSG